MNRSIEITRVDINGMNAFRGRSGAARIKPGTTTGAALQGITVEAF
jgi:hypothetical protein